MLQRRVPTVQTVQTIVETLQVLLLDWFLTCPLLWIARCHSSRLSRSSTSLSWRRGSFPLFRRPLRFPMLIGKVFDVSVVQVQQDPRVQSVRRQTRSHSCSSLNSGHCRSHARRCAMTDAGWFRCQKTVKVQQLQYFLNRWSMSLSCRSLLAQFIEILTVWRLWRWRRDFSAAFTHLSRSSRSPGVECQFWSPRW